MNESATRMIRVLYFAALRDRMGCASEDVPLPSFVSDVKSLISFLQDTRPPLKGLLGGVRFAIDEDFAAEDTVIHDGAVVALLPPASGG